MTSARLYEALKKIIANLPEHATAIDIELQARSVPVMRATIEILESDPPKSKLEDGEIATRDDVFEIVPAGTMDELVRLRASLGSPAPEPRFESTYGVDAPEPILIRQLRS